MYWLVFVIGEFPELTEFLENVALVEQEYLPTGLRSKKNNGEKNEEKKVPGSSRIISTG